MELTHVVSFRKPYDGRRNHELTTRSLLDCPGAEGMACSLGVVMALIGFLLLRGGFTWPVHAITHLRVAQ